MQDPFVTCIDPTPILNLDETGSTNAEAMRLSSTGERGPLWIAAARQSAGRGRDGRSWTSPEGNLHASLLVTLWAKPVDLPRLSLLAGVALAEAVGKLAATRPGDQPRPALKWPNDLLFDGAKCAGILVETSALKSGAFACVLGFGANITIAPAIEERAVTSLHQQSIATEPLQLLGEIDFALRRSFALLGKPEGFSELKAGWMRHSLPMGTPVTVKTRNCVQIGRFRGLDNGGALLLEDETGNLNRITHGDVSAGGHLV